jgi:hypothetical protein
MRSDHRTKREGGEGEMERRKKESDAKLVLPFLLLPTNSISHPYECMYAGGFTAQLHCSVLHVTKENTQR